VLQLFCIFNLCYMYFYFAVKFVLYFYISYNNNNNNNNYYYYYLGLCQAMLGVVELLTRYLLGGGLRLHHGILK
jgi:hypothetical protein